MILYSHAIIFVSFRFVLQGGTCKTNPIEGCSCRSGTAGYKCEFILDNFDKDVVQNDSNSNPNNNNNNNDDDDDKPAANDDSSKNKTRCLDGYCLNGGNCVTEQIILQDGTYDMEEYCDCSLAYDATSNFAGPFCQYKSTNLCFVVEDKHDDEDEDALQDEDSYSSLEETFCVHHGICQEDGSCDCPSGWTGQYCELKTLELDIDNDNDNDKPAANDDTNTDTDTDTDTTDSDTGDDFNYGTCGDTICYNGGVCVDETERLQSNGDIKLSTHCDCSTAFDDKYLYAGQSCEFPSTQLCSTPTTTAKGLEGSIFCTNHGTCMDDVQLGCECSRGFIGFACEFESRENNEVDDEDEGKGGIHWEVCGYGVCHNGGKCITSITYSKETDTSETRYSCDCKSAYNDDTAYLGPACEYPATDICVPAESGEPLSSARFCVNHGTCKEDPSRGCDCGNGFSGTFCDVDGDGDGDDDGDGDGDDIDYKECGGDLVCLNVSTVLVVFGR